MQLNLHRLRDREGNKNPQTKNNQTKLQQTVSAELCCIHLSPQSTWARADTPGWGRGGGDCPGQRPMSQLPPFVWPLALQSSTARGVSGVWFLWYLQKQGCAPYRSMSWWQPASAQPVWHPAAHHPLCSLPASLTTPSITSLGKGTVSKHSAQRLKSGTFPLSLPPLKRKQANRYLYGLQSVWHPWSYFFFLSM